MIKSIEQVGGLLHCIDFEYVDHVLVCEHVRCFMRTVFDLNIEVVVVCVCKLCLFVSVLVFDVEMVWNCFVLVLRVGKVVSYDECVCVRFDDGTVHIGCVIGIMIGEPRDGMIVNVVFDIGVSVYFGDVVLIGLVEKLLWCCDWRDL